MNEIRGQHQRKDNSIFFDQKWVKKTLKITTFEKIVLKFCKGHVFVNKKEGISIAYKKWRGKTFIFDYWITSPAHPMCRCVQTPIFSKSYINPIINQLPLL
jgi:hypothetical protein